MNLKPMNDTDIKRIDDQLDRAQKLLEKMKSDLAGFQSEVETEARDLDRKIEATEAHLKGRAGWLGMIGKQ
jgi:hypothetical protein